MPVQQHTNNVLSSQAWASSAFTSLDDWNFHWTMTWRPVNLVHQTPMLVSSVCQRVCASVCVWMVQRVAEHTGGVVELYNAVSKTFCAFPLAKETHFIEPFQFVYFGVDIWYLPIYIVQIISGFPDLKVKTLSNFGWKITTIKSRLNSGIENASRLKTT